MGVLKSCHPRPEVLSSDLADSMFAASLGSVVNKTAEEVYTDPKVFFENTHPAAQLKKISEMVFQRLANPNESGAVIRISTGFGGGKTHALVSLYHVAKNVADFSIGTELVPAAVRPSSVSVAAIDAEDAGVPDFSTHADATTKSLAGELAYRLGGKAALDRLGAADDPKGSPNAQQIAAMLPEGPTLILLDEVVVYMAKLDDQGQGNLLGFISALASAVLAKRQSVLVITDPASQQAYASQAHLMEGALREAATKLEQILGRKFSDFDPIKDEAAQVIARRLFTSIDRTAAEAVSASYRHLFERVKTTNGSLLPPSVTTPDEIQKFVSCYPFHPRLLETAQNRLSTIPDYNKGRGTLRLFARLLRDIWDRQEDVELIGAGDVNWESDRIRGDLLQRLNKDEFTAAVNADVVKHAGELDGGSRGHHVRAASALLLESLPQTPTAAMTPQELTYAILRPEDAGEETVEALDRLLNVCWYTYPSESGDRYQFRVEPNVIKQVEERAQGIRPEDARGIVRTRVSGYYNGTFFQSSNWPEDLAAVPRTAKPLLVLCDHDALGKDIAQFENVDAEGHKNPRGFINNLIVLVPDQNLFASAIERAKKLKAAEAIEAEAKQGKGNPLAIKQLEKFLPSWRRQFRIEAVRAFTRLVLHSGEHRIGEEILANEDKCAEAAAGQQNLKDFLEKKSLIYKAQDALDFELFRTKVFDGTPDDGGQSGVKNAAALYERMLSVPGLRLLGDGSLLRETVRKAVTGGQLVVRLADGRCFDAKGCVAGEIGSRKRQPYSLTMANHSEVLVAIPTAAAAATWFVTDEPEPIGGDRETDGAGITPPPPPRLDDNVATTWEDAIEKARGKQLLSLKLTARNPAALAAFPSVTVMLSPNEQKQSLRVSGVAKDGGNISLAFSNVKPSHPLRPSQLVAQVFIALVEEGRVAFFVQENAFSSDRTGMADRIAEAREAANGMMQLDGIEIEAKFQ
jgi:hypothetical protein